MRVLIVDKTGGVHSGQERTRALAAAVGGEVHLVAPEMWIENGRTVPYPNGREDSFTAHTFRVGFNGYYSRAFYREGLAGVVKRVRPDVIHLLEEPWSFFAWQAMAAGRRVRPRAALILYTWENIYRGFRYPSRISFLHSFIERRVYSRARGIVCATDVAADVVRRKSFPGRILVAPYGIDDTFFDAGARRDAAMRRDRPAIGYVGRLLEMKGVDTLITAAAGLGQVELRLLGSGPDESRLRRLAADLGAEDRVHFHPAVPVEKVPGFMAGLDVLVLPSRTKPFWAEQLGRVLPEAMAAGTPVAGSDSGCIPWVIGYAGVVFKEGDARDLGEKLARILGSRDLWCELSRRGRERALERFTWRRFAGDVAEFYKDLLRD